MRITEVYEPYYREHGLAIVEMFYTLDDLSGALSDCDEVVQCWVDYLDEAISPNPDTCGKPYLGHRSMHHFSYKSTTLNDLTSHEQLRHSATAMAGDKETRGAPSHVSYNDIDYREDPDHAIHLKFCNHTLAYPQNDQGLGKQPFCITSSV